jgi:hypothetical protein
MLVEPMPSIVDCLPSQLYDELAADSYGVKIDYLNTKQEEDGSWTVCLFVTSAEKIEFDATIAAHVPTE